MHLRCICKILSPSWNAVCWDWQSRLHTLLSPGLGTDGTGPTYTFGSDLSLAAPNPPCSHCLLMELVPWPGRVHCLRVVAKVNIGRRHRDVGKVCRVQRAFYRFWFWEFLHTGGRILFKQQNWHWLTQRFFSRSSPWVFESWARCLGDEKWERGCWFSLNFLLPGWMDGFCTHNSIVLMGPLLFKA